MTLQMGVLLCAKRYRRMLGGDFEARRLLALEHERVYGVRTLFAPPAQVCSETDTALMARATSWGWQEETVEPIPRIYHNLLTRPIAPEARALRDLNGASRLVLFNEINHWHRGMIFGILSALSQTQVLMPPSEPLQSMPPDPGVFLVATAHRRLRDKGILMESGIGRRLRYTNLSVGRTGTLLQETCAETLRLALPLQPLWLSRLYGRPVGPDGPVEWRFYVHRAESGAWEVAGAVAKRDAARLGARRERCWPLAEALSLTFGSDAGPLADRLHRDALAVIKTLALFLPGIAHCALDFWLDQEGRPMLVDLTGCYRTDWLARAGEDRMLKRVLDHPARFARLLDRTGVEKLHVDFGRSGRNQRTRSGDSSGTLG